MAARSKLLNFPSTNYRVRPYGQPLIRRQLMRQSITAAMWAARRPAVVAQVQSPQQPTVTRPTGSLGIEYSSSLVRMSPSSSPLRLLDPNFLRVERGRLVAARTVLGKADQVVGHQTHLQ
jgi:hypothetical protein